MESSPKSAIQKSQSIDYYWKSDIMYQNIY